MNYSKRLSTLSPSATLQLSAKAKELKRAGKDIVSLSAGQPDFETPGPIAEAGIQAVRDGHTGYTASTGIPELKNAVAKKYSEKHDMEWTAENVVVGCGAKHCLSNLMLSAVNPEDGVLLPRPYWVSYPEMVKAAGGRPLYPETGRLTPDDVRRAFAEGAVGMLMNYPSNPEGYVPSKQEMKSIADAVAETGMWVISDDIYEDLCYLKTGVPHLLDFRPELKDRTAVVSGVSKTFAMTGWRIGYFLADRQWAKTAGTFQAHSTSNPCSVSQWAALAAVEGRAEEERKKMLESFSRRRDLICSLLSGDKFVQFTVPDGAFYVFLKVNNAVEPDSARLCSRLLEEEGLAVIPGSAFGAEGHIRLSFAASEENIREGVRRLMRFLHRRYDT